MLKEHREKCEVFYPNWQNSSQSEESIVGNRTTTNRVSARRKHKKEKRAWGNAQAGGCRPMMRGERSV